MLQCLSKTGLALTTVCVLVLSAPSWAFTAKEERKLRQVNVTSVTKQKVAIAEDQVFAWQQPLLVIGAEEGQTASISEELVNRINSDLIARKYAVAVKSPEIPYHLVGFVLLENSAEHDNHELLIGLDPGMRPSKDFGLGTLVLGVKDKNNTLVWRGAVQVLTAGNKLPKEQRDARLEKAVRMLVDSFFEGNAS